MIFIPDSRNSTNLREKKIAKYEQHLVLLIIIDQTSRTVNPCNVLVDTKGAKYDSDKNIRKQNDKEYGTRRRSKHRNTRRDLCEGASLIVKRK